MVLFFSVTHLGHVSGRKRVENVNQNIKCHNYQKNRARSGFSHFANFFFQIQKVKSRKEPNKSSGQKKGKYPYPQNCIIYYSGMPLPIGYIYYLRHPPLNSPGTPIKTDPSQPQQKYFGTQREFPF